MRTLLSDKNEKYFGTTYPLFYKNSDGGSAIDQALEINQIRTVNLILKYICTY